MLSSESVNEINELLNSFYQLANEEYKSLLSIDLVSKTSFDNFYDRMLVTFDEIKNDSSNKKVRHLILRKKSKLIQELKNKLPLLECIENFNNDIQNSYWITIHKCYILVESSRDNPDEAVINTIVNELESRIVKITKKEEQLSGQPIIKNFNDLLTETSGLMGGTDLSSVMNLLDNPLFKSLGIDNVESIINGFISDPKYQKLFPILLMAVKNNDLNNPEILKLADEYLPKVDVNDPKYQTFTNMILENIKYINNNDREKIAEKSMLVGKYLFDNNIDIMTIISYAIEATKNEEHINKVRSLCNADFNAKDFILTILESIPSEVIEGYGLGSLDNIKMIINMFDMSQGSLMENLGGLQNLMGNFAAKPKVNEELTPEQLAELEVYMEKLLKNV